MIRVVVMMNAEDVRREVFDILMIRDAIKECNNTLINNAHVIDYKFWEIKKDQIWYWFPMKNYKSVITLKNRC